MQRPVSAGVIARRQRGLIDRALRAQVMGKDRAQLVVLDLADIGGAPAQMRDARDGVGRRSARDFLRRADPANKARPPRSHVDQLHDALLDAVFGPETRRRHGPAHRPWHCRCRQPGIFVMWSSPRKGTDRGSGRRRIWVCAPCRYSGRAGSASDAHGAGIRPGCCPRWRVRPRRRPCPGQMPVRLPTRKIWVSTACAGCPPPHVQHHIGGLAPDARAAIAARRATRAPRRHSRRPGCGSA